MSTVRSVLAAFILGILVFSVVKCEVYRLPKEIKPVKYILQMEPNLTNEWPEPNQYYGNIVMEIKARENTRNVTFHVSDVKINADSIKLFKTGGTTVKVARTSLNPEAETYTVGLEEDLVKGEYYNLTIGDFSGNLGDGVGFFSARYRRNDDKYYEPAGVIAVTHFEPTGARKAFPCFDEPALKAKFIINLIRPEGYTSLSNQELETTESLGNGRFKDTFKETPPMSTFNVAFAVSDFASTEKVERHRIFAQPAAFNKSELGYSLETSVKTLQVLEEFFGINFTLNKIDSFAVPYGYFHESAMENWGLVVFSEEHLRYSPSKSISTLKRITTYIAHEFAHQWFGNLVTPEWWDYLWLSESFAAYFQYYIASLVKPDWRLMDQFRVEMVIESFDDEEKHDGAHPLTFRIQRSGQYPPFNIMYQKGASLVNMMSHFLSQDVFRRGLHIYLEKNQFSNTVPSDLYAALQQAVDEAGTNDLLDNLSVAQIFETWEHSAGYPIVTVTRDYKTGSITVKQSTKFTDDGDKKVWKIPVNYILSASNHLDFSNTTADFWLTEESRTINKNFPTDGWLLVNKQLTGYYRVNYDAENWNRIIKVLKSDNFESIHVLNRAQLINDALYFANHDEMPFKTALTLCEYLVREKDFIAWNSFYHSASSYIRIYHGHDDKEEHEYFKNHPLSKTITPSTRPGGYEPEYLTFQQYIRTITKHIRDDLGEKPKENESMLDTMNRNELDRHFPWNFRRDGPMDYKLMLSLIE